MEERPERLERFVGAALEAATVRLLGHVCAGACRRVGSVGVGSDRWRDGEVAGGAATAALRRLQLGSEVEAGRCLCFRRRMYSSWPPLGDLE